LAKTYFNAPLTESEYILNSFNYFKFDKDNYLVTAEHGSWVLLSKKEFDLLRLHKLSENPELFSILKEKGFILSEDNIQQVIEGMREHYSFLFQGPSLHILTPTMRCNQRCIYCHSRAESSTSKGYDMDEKTAKKIVDFMFLTPAKSIVIEFQGGECLLNFPVVETVIDYAREKSKETGKKVQFSVVSNFTLLNDEILDSLKERKVMGLSTSLDGPKEVHDFNRKFLDGKGSYDSVEYWIKRIKDEFKYDFNLNALCTVSRKSLSMGKEIIDTYSDLGFTHVWLRGLNNIGFASETWKKIGYSPQEFVDFYKKTLDYIIQKNIDGKKMVELMTTIFLKKIMTKRGPMFVDIQSPCGAAIGQLLYNYKGDIYTCDEGKLFNELKIGNVFTSTYSEIFDNDTVKAMLDVSSKKNYLCDNCAFSPYCGICPIYTYAAQGTIVSKIAEDDKCKTYKEVIKTVFSKILFSEKDRDILFDWIGREKVFS